MAKFTWQDGTLVSKAKVEIGGVIYEVDPEEYSGTTPLSAANLNAMQDGIYEDIGDKEQLKTNNKTNLVSAINSIVDGEVYSTDEVKTNKVWFGKPIYRKVVDVAAPLGPSGQDHEHNISNLGIVINVYGAWYSTPFGQQPLTRSVPGDNNGYGVGIGDITDTRFRLNYGTGLSGVGHVYVVFEYTKTTD